jgi:DNA primase
MIDDVELLLSTHGIKYQKKGNNIMCLCPNPNHKDRHIGSFSFDKYKGLGHCFACGCSVNIYSFNKLLGEKIEYDKNVNYDFTKSLKPKKEEIIYNKPIVYGKLYNPFANNKVMNFIHSIGWSNEFVKEKDVKYCRYAEMISENLVNEVDEKPTVMENRICIPIFGKDKNLINYECRTFVDNPNIPKVKYVRGCSSNYIFGFNDIDFNKEVVLTEGIKNVGKCWSVCKNVISTFGNQLTDVKLEMLNKIQSICVFLDFDLGGLTLAKKLKEGYDGNLRATFNPKKYRDSNGQLKGKDLNDCTFDEIRYYLNHTMSIDKAIQRLSDNDESNEVFWN